VRYAVFACIFLSGLLFACQGSTDSTNPSLAKGPSKPAPVLITKEPTVFASHNFDPTAPPPEMPPLAPGEGAECDSNYLAQASVRGQPRRTDSTHATITITQIMMRLKLEIHIWLPSGASQAVVEHEQGHRQISEYYYQTADKLAERIAGAYVGRRVEVEGTDLDGETNKAMLQMATEITNEYTKQINSNATQLLYDTITDHARNGVVASDAVDHAIKNAPVEASPQATPALSN
jgi:hypothetical protein